MTCWDGTVFSAKYIVQFEIVVRRVSRTWFIPFKNSYFFFCNFPWTNVKNWGRGVLKFLTSANIPQWGKHPCHYDISLQLQNLDTVCVLYDCKWCKEIKYQGSVQTHVRFAQVSHFWDTFAKTSFCTSKIYVIFLWTPFKTFSCWWFISEA